MKRIVKIVFIILLMITGLVCIGFYISIGDYSSKELVTGIFKYAPRNGNLKYMVLGTIFLVTDYIILKYENK